MFSIFLNILNAVLKSHSNGIFQLRLSIKFPKLITLEFCHVFHSAKIFIPGSFFEMDILSNVHWSYILFLSEMPFISSVFLLIMMCIVLIYLINLLKLELSIYDRYYKYFFLVPEVIFNSLTIFLQLFVIWSRSVHTCFSSFIPSPFVLCVLCLEA